MTEEEYQRELERYKSIALKYEKKVQHLKSTIKELNTDKITKIDTRASGNKKINNLFRYIVLNGYKYIDGIGVLFIDIDDFKQANDTYGHVFGDKVLRIFASKLKSNISVARKDIVCRWGGDEFLVILNNVTNEECIACAKKIAYDIKNQSNLDYSITSSIGLLHISKEELSTARELYISGNGESQSNVISHYIEEVDSALYNAKKNGKDKIVDYSNGLIKVDINPKTKKLR